MLFVLILCVVSALSWQPSCHVTSYNDVIIVTFDPNDYCPAENTEVKFMTDGVLLKEVEKVGLLYVATLSMIYCLRLTFDLMFAVNFLPNMSNSTLT